MTATLAASQAILKVRYPNGKLPKSVYDQPKFKFINTVDKREDFTGELRMVAVQNENPQGSSVDFNTAVGSLAQGSYKRFQVTRTEHFGVARIKGQAMKAAEGNEGALVDLWKNETDGISMTEMQNLEIYAFGNGTGVLGRIASGSTGATITLSVLSDAAKFSLGMRLQAVSSATSLSPTLRAGIGTITGIDRTAGTLTCATTWNAQITGIGSTDYLVRAGDSASGGTAGVISGMGSWISGSATATLFSLDRSSDYTRLAGNTFDATGVPMEEVFIEASALVSQQGAPQPGIAFVHPRDIGNFKKTLQQKSTYNQAEIKSTVAGVSFKGVEIEGDEGRIVLLTSPFISRNQCFLVHQPSWKLDSLGPAPQMLDFDSNNFLRVASDDAYEVRFGSYAQVECNMPYANVNITNFGA